MELQTMPLRFRVWDKWGKNFIVKEYTLVEMITFFAEVGYDKNRFITSQDIWRIANGK